MIPMLERIAREVWSYHYRIPEMGYWAALISAILVTLIHPAVEDVEAVATFVLVLSAVGIMRWRIAKRRCRFGMIVPLFQEGAGAKGRAREAQTLIVDHLRRHVPDPLKSLIQPVPVEVSSAEDRFAAKLQRRFRALYVLHGRIASQGDSWSIYPRVLDPANEKVTHLDLFTHDRTPSNPRFGPFVTSLQPSVGVRDEEFPLDFCRDLEAIIHGLAGMAMVAFQQYEAAVELLDKALGKAPNSLNHQIDALRVARARAQAELGSADEAIDALRNRLQQPNPSPHLLRGLAHLLTGRSWEKSPSAEADREEAKQLLRQAREDETDPQRDMTTYNLVMLVPFWDDDGEGGELLADITRPRSSYRRLWYVRKLVADRAWNLVEEARKAGDDDAVRRHGSEAAKWYSRTLRARPRVQFLGVMRRRPFLRLRTFPRSPILYGNAKDGHEAAGHRLRTRYLEWRFQCIRSRMLNLGDRALECGDWERAYAHFDWASCVGRHDATEHVALAWSACFCWKAGHKKDGLRMWEEAAHHDPSCLFARALLRARLDALELDSSLPGTEPTDIDEVVEVAQARFPGWALDQEGNFISPENLDNEIVANS